MLHYSFRVRSVVHLFAPTTSEGDLALVCVRPSVGAFRAFSTKSMEGMAYGLKFIMLLYLDRLQKGISFGHGLLISYFWRKFEKWVNFWDSRYYVEKAWKEWTKMHVLLHPDHLQKWWNLCHSFLFFYFSHSLRKKNRSDLGVLVIYLENAWTNCLIFGLLADPEHFLKWFYFGHGLLIGMEAKFDVLGRVLTSFSVI